MCFISSHWALLLLPLASSNTKHRTNWILYIGFKVDNIKMVPILNRFFSQFWAILSDYRRFFFAIFSDSRPFLANSSNFGQFLCNFLKQFFGNFKRNQAISNNFQHFKAISSDFRRFLANLTILGDCFAILLIYRKNKQKL